MNLIPIQVAQVVHGEGSHEKRRVGRKRAESWTNQNPEKVGLRVFSSTS